MFPDCFFHVGDLTDGERNSTRKRPCGLAVSPLHLRVSCISNAYSGTEELKIVSQSVFYHSLAGPNSCEIVSKSRLCVVCTRNFRSGTDLLSQLTLKLTN